MFKVETGRTSGGRNEVWGWVRPLIVLSQLLVPKLIEAAEDIITLMGSSS